MTLQSTNSGTMEPGSSLNPNAVIEDAQSQLELVVDAKCPSCDLKAASTLRALIDHAPALDGQLYLAHCILDVVRGKPKDEKVTALVDLAQAWLDDFLFPIRAIGANWKLFPVPSQVPSCDDPGVTLERARQGDQIALSSLLHAREGFKCAISGDLSWYFRHLGKDQGVAVGVVQVAHILPLQLSDLNESESELEGANIAWDMLCSWTSMDQSAFSRAEMNMPKNAMILRSDLHGLFAEYGLWFVPVPNESNTYRVETLDPHEFKGRAVTFVDQSSQDHSIELPDPKYLAIHAALAKVLHDSGAEEYFEEIWTNTSAHQQLGAEGTLDTNVVLQAASAGNDS